MIITIVGTNRFAMKRRLDELVSKFVAVHGGLALERIDADEAEPQAIIETLQSIPFLSPRKMVVLRDLAGNKQAGGRIEQIIDAVGETTDLIIYDTEIDKRTTYFKMLKKRTQLEEFSELAVPALVSWLVNEAKLQNGELKPADANYLIERVGPNQSLLFNELSKLIIYNPKVSRETIELLTEAMPRSKVFELLDAAFGGNKARALMLYGEQRAQQVEPQAIMAMLAWQLNLLCAVKYSGERSSSQVAADFGINPYPVGKAANLAKKISDAKLRKLVNEAFELDRKSKTSAVDLDEALKTYLVTM